MPIDPNKWTVKSGKQIKIEDMSTRHLNNTIRFLEARVPQYRHRLYAEYTDRALSCLVYAQNAPDGAAIAAESESDHLFDEAFEALNGIMSPLEVLTKGCPQYPLMLKEKDKRNAS